MEILICELLEIDNLLVNVHECMYFQPDKNSPTNEILAIKYPKIEEFDTAVMVY